MARTRTWAVAILAASGLLPGCLSPAEPPADGMTTWQWGIDGCAFLIAVAPVEADRLQPHLPSGFTPKGSPQAVPPTEAEVHFDAYVCRGGTGPEGQGLGPTLYGSVYVPVDVPSELAVDGYDAYFVKTDALMHPSVQGRYAERGFPAWTGDAQVTQQGLAWQASLDMGEGGGFAFSGAAGPPSTQGQPLPFVEYTPLADGSLARWRARLHDASIASGTGLLEVRGGWAEAVTGPRVQASFIAGTWNLDETTVEFPVAWP